MESSHQVNEIAALKDQLGLKVEEMAEKLGCSKGHVSDLCTGRRAVTARIAHKLEAISGRPWHEWMQGPSQVAA